MLTDLIGRFPNLQGSGYRRTSSPTTDYNCIAWAADRTDLWFWPDPNWAYWPDNIPCEISRRAFVALFKSLGYVQCRGADLEAGFEKITIYELGGVPQHAAKQLGNGMWTSKLGKLDDISHPLNALDGAKYGQPSIFMRRPLIEETDDA